MDRIGFHQWGRGYVCVNGMGREMYLVKCTYKNILELYLLEKLKGKCVKENFSYNEWITKHTAG